MTKPFFAYRSFWKEFDAMKRFADLGVREFCVFAGNSTNSMGEPYSQYAPVWLWYDAYDFSSLDEQIGDVLKICPEAKILCLIDLNSPLWLARQLQIDSYSELSGALSMPEWRRETEKFVKAFVEYTEKKFGNVIECYILMCGKTDEWMDVSKGAEKSHTFETYEAWCRKEGLPLPEDVPSFKARRQGIPVTGNCIFRNPETQMNAIRYIRFLSALVAESIAGFSQLVRENVSADKKIGVFYGYQLQLAEHSAALGHAAYRKVAALPSVDFFISPGQYWDRAMGGASGFMTPNGTLHLFHKECLYEIDHRTTTSNMQLTKFVSLKWSDRWKSKSEDIAGLRREFCRTLFHGSHLWWFDMWGGFFNEPHQMETIRQCFDLWQRYGDTKAQPDAEIALIVDPESSCFFPDRGVNERLYHVQYSLARIGAPFRVYTLEDLSRLPEKIKLLVFASTAVITPEIKNVLESKIFPEKRCIWCGPCGISDGEKMIQLSLPGVRIEDPNDVPPRILRTEAEKAGVFLFTDRELPVWYGRDLLMLHSAEEQDLAIRVPEDTKSVRELFSGTEYAVKEKTFHYHFSAPETVLFQLFPDREQK